jgi:hypothetical protein
VLDEILTRVTKIEEHLRAIGLAVGAAPAVCLSKPDAA